MSISRNNLLNEHDRLWQELEKEIGEEPMKTVNRLVEIEHELTRTVDI